MKAKTNTLAKAAAHCERVSRDIVDERARLIDEYGALTEKLQPLRSGIRRHEALAKLLRAYAGDVAPEKTLTIRGFAYEVTLGPRENKTVFAPMAKIYRVLGKETFLKLATVTLGALEAYVHPERVAELTHQEQTGSREITVRTQEQAKAA